MLFGIDPLRLITRGIIGNQPSDEEVVPEFEDAAVDVDVEDSITCELLDDCTIDICLKVI